MLTILQSNGRYPYSISSLTYCCLKRWEGVEAQDPPRKMTVGSRGISNTRPMVGGGHGSSC